MKSPLLELGNIPVRSSVIASLYPKIKAKNKKIAELEKSGEVIRLKQGLYIVSPQESGLILSTELIANHLYAPSYVSMSSALRYYGLIPESVYTMQSMTTKHSRDFTNTVGRFEYTHINKEVFSVGLRQVKEDHLCFIIATPEKALCDLIANSPNITLRYQKEAAIYLAEDLRFDMEAFSMMNPEIFHEYIKVGKKVGSIQTLLKLLKR